MINSFHASTPNMTITWVKCPCCGVPMMIEHPSGQPRFLMPLHGNTPEMECPAGDKVYRMKNPN